LFSREGGGEEVGTSKPRNMTVGRMRVVWVVAEGQWVLRNEVKSEEAAGF